jgi:DNA-binding NarL/FixJ family response regulator
MINIIVADDHQMFIDGIKLLLKMRKDFSVVAEANTGIEVLEVLKVKKADLIGCEYAGYGWRRNHQTGKKTVS